ncbi:S9 family peptidase [Cyclobacterium salsum]|uniref:S9 family peptidase n=1 Tax=Cyclobacterium salsum TaxID=2666329 RepID=UPI0013918DC0|nr:S9 family peptidase [Cyclobacterium salsum]
MKIYSLLATLPFLILPWTGYGQGSLEDYQRAAAVKEAYKDKVYHSPRGIQWQEENVLTYSVRTTEGIRYLKIDPDGKEKAPLFDHFLLAKALADSTGREYSERELKLTDIKLEKGKIQFKIQGLVWEWDKEQRRLEKIEEPESPDSRYWGTIRPAYEGKPVSSPDGKKEAFIRDYNVYVKDLTTGKEEKLSSDGVIGDHYAARLEWSGDSKKLATFKFRPSEVRKLTLIASSPSDQLQPKLIERDYLKPGDAMPVRVPVIFNLENGSSWKAPLNQMDHQFALTRLNWKKDGSAVRWEYNQRGHQLYKVFEMDAETGTLRTLIEEKSPTFIDYSGKYFRKDLEKENQILWASERDGWRHLYLSDDRTGELLRQVTRGEWVVREILQVDEEAGVIYFTASGKNKNEDPYHLHFYKIGIDGNDLVQLTEGNANHEISLSSDQQYFVDHYSRQDLLPTTVLKDAGNGELIMELEKADIAALRAEGWSAPEIFKARGRDGKTDIWGLIIKPSNFDPGKTYPVIEYIYAGPHSAFVPKSFAPNYNGLNELAELGFVVVQMDGMGTSNRSKAFHDVAWKNLKDAGFPDRIQWMKAAAKDRPYMDLERVGIFGTSAGGQSAAGALLFHPEFYKVAVSSCGCHDNRMDKIWWNEQWMGYPVDVHYEESSNVVHAKNLEGKLLLIVGEVDDNVDPSSTYQFADQLIKNDKEFEFLMIPGMGHSSGGAYGERKRRDFFVKHLLGVTPPAWDKRGE